MRLPLIVVLLFLVLALVIACAPTASAPAPAAPAPAASPSPSVAGSTIGQLASVGESVFGRRCAQCHGSSGQGAVAPAIIGDKANLHKYGDGNELFSVISTRMPKNAPGQLGPEEYAQVVSYLLVQNNFVTEDTAFAADKLAQIKLGK